MFNFISDRFWQRLSWIIGLMAIGMVFGLAAFSSSIEVKDLDLWLHLGTGRYIVQNGYVPDHDILSCTIAGKPWVNHEWLFQIIVYYIHHLWGFDGLILMQSIVVCLTFFILLLLGYSNRAQILNAGILFVVLLVYQTRFTIRPDIFSLLFLAIFIYIFSKHLHKTWSLYVLIIVQALWVNMHGFFLFGPLMAGIFVLTELIKRKLPLPAEWNTASRLTDEQYQRLKMIAIVLPFACLLNPMTLKGALYPLGVFFQLNGDSKIFFHHIVELRRPITGATLFTGEYGYYKVLIIVSAYSFIFNRRRIDLNLLVLWILFLLFSLAAIRNLVFFGFVAYIAFMINIKDLTLDDIVPFRFSTPQFKSITGVIAKILLIFMMLNRGLDWSVNGYFDFDTYQRKSEFWGVSKRSYPYKGVDFLVNNGIKGNFFNDFNSGAYLIGRTHPNIKVFIDGRTEEYGGKFFEQYQKIWKDGDAKLFGEFARKDNITGAFLNSTSQEIPSKVSQMFYSFKDWSVVYFDDDALIFLKQTPQNRAWIARFGIDLTKWEPKHMDLLRLGTTRIDPFPFTNRAFTLDALGLEEPALKELREALIIDPAYVPAHKLMGKIYGQQKKHRLAFEHLRIASMYYSHDTQIRANLALAYENLKDYRGAMLQYQKITEYAPNDPTGYYGISKMYALLHQYKKSIDELKQAHQMDTKDTVDVEKIRDIIVSQNVNADVKKMLNDVVPDKKNIKNAT